MNKTRTGNSISEKKFHIPPKRFFSLRKHRKGNLQSKNWDFNQFSSPTPKYDFQCQILFKCDPYSWAKTGISEVEDRGFTNTFQE